MDLKLLTWNNHLKYGRNYQLKDREVGKDVREYFYNIKRVVIKQNNPSDEVINTYIIKWSQETASLKKRMLWDEAQQK